MIEQSELLFFDRALPDVFAYARWYGQPIDEIRSACKVFRYKPQVFFLRPWQEIYVTDDERKMTYNQSLIFDRYLEEAYLNSNYNLVEVPKGSVEERVNFVLANIDRIK